MNFSAKLGIGILLIAVLLGVGGFAVWKYGDRILKNAPTLEKSFQIKGGETQSIRSEGIHVTFKDVFDSRCPKDVQCIWAGEARVTAHILKNEQDLGDFALTLGASGTEKDLNPQFFDGYSVTLLKLNPYPMEASQVELSQYIATLVVSKTEQKLGIIEGSLGYPSEGIPSDMKVCAENIATKRTYCTEEHRKDTKYTYGEGYQIEIPSGDYYVYATLPSWKNYKAYYSDFVICGLSVDCSSHKPILVQVKSGQIVSGIDPQDWYDTSNKTSDWQAMSYEKAKFEFRYPNNFFYSKPEVIQINGDNSLFYKGCPYVKILGLQGDATQEGLTDLVQKGIVKLEKIDINNVGFCYEEFGEGAAGSTYVDQYYITKNNTIEYFALHFVMKYTNCGVFGSPGEKAYEDCRYENTVMKPEMVKKILSTFQFK